MRGATKNAAEGPSGARILADPQVPRNPSYTGSRILARGRHFSHAPAMRASLGVSTRLDTEAAAAEAVASVRAGLDGRPPSSAIVVATAAWGERAIRRLVGLIAEDLATPALVGGSVDGLLADGREIEHSPGVAILAIHGLEAEAHLCTELAGDEGRAGPEIASALHTVGSASDLALVFADSLSLSASALLASLGAALGPTRLAGIGASEPLGAPALVWAGDDVATEACAVLLARPERPARLAVTSGLLARTAPMRISRAQDNWVLGLDGRPALDVLRPALPESLRGHREPRHLLVALTPGSAAGSAGAEIGLIRNVVGFDERRRAFALPEPVIEGEQLALVTLDAAAAREDLVRALESADCRRAAFGCYLSCRSRGQALFASADVESGYLASAFGAAPVLGMTGAYQLGPSGALADAVDGLHTHAGILAVVDA